MSLVSPGSRGAAPEASPDRRNPVSGGTRLGPYEVVSALGSGGMGQVYRARDPRLGRQVAIKVLPAEAASDAARLKRFEKEAQAASALNHPNIVTIYEVDRVDSTTFIVMELVEGKTLREVLAEGALPTRKLLAIASQIADGLAKAHASGIVHRDLKPENVMVTEDGLVKILDFGLAKLAHPEREGGQPVEVATVSEATAPGIAMGTVGYMSPEQASGHPVDFHSDQFSFGSILYELVTGQRPFKEKTAPETLAAIIREDPKPIASVAPGSPAPLRWTVERCLAKEPKERYASTEDLAKELRSFQLHLSQAVSATDMLAGEAAPLRRRAFLWALAAAAVVAGALGLLVAGRFPRPGSHAATPLSLTLSFPVDAAPDTYNTNPLAISPDARTLVYAGVRGGRRKLFVRSLDRDEIREIPDTEGASKPFFSPDGLWVGFFGEKKLKKVALAGGSPITLCDAPSNRGGSWGAGDTIVFVPALRSGLERIPAAGGEPKAVTTLSDPENVYSHYFPQILPDGESVLFEIRYFDRASQAAVVSLRTGERRVILENAVCPWYLPTGHLVFTRAGLL